MLRAFADAGYQTEETDQTWLYKATKDGVLVDVIFESTGGIVLDDEMLSRVRQGTFEHLRLNVLGPEDLLVIKAIVHREHRQRHWFDALALVETGELDWPYLLRRATPARAGGQPAAVRPDRRPAGARLGDRVAAGAGPRAGGGADVPDEYLVAHANEALAADPHTAELELDVVIDGREVVVTGTVATPERRAAVGEVVAKALPGREVRNLTDVEDDVAEPFVETLP